jgi:hypothetical protein
MNIADMEVGKVYSFSMKSVLFHGARVERARLLSAGADISIAKLIAPIEQQYSQIYPSLPNGTSFSPANCKYYIFEQINGEKLALADQWIVDGSVEEIVSIVYSVKIYDGSLGEVDKIRAALAAVGKTNITIEVL